MALLLSIETATPVCSVALSSNGVILTSRESTDPNSHASLLGSFIQELTGSGDYPLSALDAVAVSMGPGSFTGLRIGVSTAKGLCYGLGIPLIGIPTLEAMAGGMRACGHEGTFTPPPAPPQKGRGEFIRHLYCPMIDARRMEDYCAVYSETMEEVMPVDARIITEDSFANLLERFIIVFGGNGAAKCHPVLGSHPNARILDGFYSSAEYMVAQAEQRFTAGRFENLAYCEPFYLKNFVAGKPRVKGL